MKIKSERKGNITEIVITGELGHHEAIEAMAKIREEIERAAMQTIVLNLSQLTFMDSSGIAVVIKAYKNAQTQGGSLKVYVEEGHKKKILLTSGLNKIIEFI